MAAGQPSTATAQPGAVSAYKAPGLRSYARRTADRLSFKVNLIVGISALVLLTGVALIVIADRSSRATASQFAGGLFRGASEHVVTQARSFVNRAVPLVDSMARLGDNGLALDDSDRLARQLVAILPANPGVTWLSFSDEAGTFTGAYRTAAGTYRVNQSRIVDGRTRLAEHNVLPGGQWAIHRRLEDTGYEPRVRPFYVEARGAGAMVWLPPYVFYDEAVPGVSCAKPLYGGDKQLLGVVSADFDLNTLSSFVSGLSVSKNSKFFLFTQDGTLLAYPRTQVV